MIFIPILGGLMPLVILGGIIVLIVRAVGRRGGDVGGQPSGTTIRRFFQYSLMLALLWVAATGLVGLIQQVLPRDGAFASDGTTALARSLSFVLVGGPALAALAAWNVRVHAADPQERYSIGFAFYLTAALSGSLVIGGFAAFRTLRWVVAESSLDEGALAVALVAAAVWVIHRRVAGLHGEPRRMELNRIIGSAAGLVGVAVAVGFGLTAAVGELYDAAYNTFVTDSLGDDLRVALAGVLVAGPVWWWHWIRPAHRSARTTLWHAYVLLFGVLGALLTAMAAAGTMLFLLLERFVGDPDTASSAEFFDPVPAALAAIVVGGVGWWYHRQVLASAPADGRTEVDRAYEYLVAAVGLLAGAAGAATLLAALVEAATPGGRTIASGSGSDVLVVALTLVGVGLPVWLTYWARIRRRVRHDELTERASTVRRVYLLVLAGLAGAVLPFALLAVVVISLEDLLDGRFGFETVRNLQVGFGLLVTAGVVAGYHLAVLQRDRAVLPAAVRPVVRDVVLVSGNGADVAAAISTQVGARVRVWHRLDLAAEQGPPVDDVVAAIRAESHEHVMVLSGAGGAFEVVPFADH